MHMKMAIPKLQETIMYGKRRDWEQKRELLERSKPLATKEDLTENKKLQSNTDILESCTRERANTKWQFYKLMIVTIFAARFKGVPMGCKDTLSPNPLLKSQSVKCLTFERNSRKSYNVNLCLFRALTMPLHGTERFEEETSKFFNLFLVETGRTDPANFRGVFTENFAAKEHIDQIDIFLYHIDIIDGSVISELERRSVGKLSNTLRLIPYNNNHICYVSKINALFKTNRCPSSEQIIKNVGNLERHLTLCKEKTKQVSPKICEKGFFNC